MTKNDSMFSSREYLPQLDALRGVCALIVVLYHVPFINLTKVSIVNNGYLFVDFFFVLSGFVMYYTSSDRPFSAKSYMLARFFRVYPVHFVMLLIFLLYEILQWVVSDGMHIISNVGAFEKNNFTSFFMNLLLLNGVGIVHESNFNTPSWSISSEFWTYFAFSIVMTFVSKRFVRFIFVALSIFGLLTVIAFDFQGGLAQTGRLALPRCFYSFFLGGLVCAFRLKAVEASRGGVSVAQVLALGASIAMVIFAGRANRTGDFFVPIGFALLIYFLSSPQSTFLSKVLSTPVMRKLGDLSYSIYMVHMIVVAVVVNGYKLLLGPPVGNAANALAAAIILLTLIAAVILNRVIEVPARKWGKRLTLGTDRTVLSATAHAKETA